jgi:hypothetical protein
MFPNNTRLGGRMKLFVVGILYLSVTACTPTPSVPIPIPGPKASPKLASEIINTSALTPRDGAGAILVVRDKTRLFRKGCTYDVALDGQLMVGLRNGEQVTLYADPGGRSIVVSIRPEDSCDPVVAQVPVQVVASATTKIRIVADLSYDLKIESTTY